MSNKGVVLVTGAAGFLGSHVADHCLNLGFDVIATDNLSGGFRKNVPGSAHWIEGDLRDARFVSSIFANWRFKYVYHLAAYAAEGLSHFVRRFNYETNLVASINLLDESVKQGVACFIFTSSIAVYGANQTPMIETLTPRPEDPYGISKYAVELDLCAAYEMFGLNYIVFRPHNVYGERQNIADRYRNVVGIFMNQVMQKKPMTVFGDGLQTRAFSHVDDVAPLIARSPLTNGAINEVFNIGADRPYTILELANEVARAFDVDPKIKYLPPRNEVVHAFSDHRKVRSIFQAAPTVDLREGIRRMSKWAKSTGPQAPTTFSDIEITKNLPPSWQH